MTAECAQGICRDRPHPGQTHAEWAAHWRAVEGHDKQDEDGRFLDGSTNRDHYIGCDTTDAIECPFCHGAII